MTHRRFVPFALLLAVSGCSGLGRSPDRPPHAVWSGQVTVREDVVIPRGGSLTVLPGTVVRFAFRDDDGDGWGDASIRVEGDLRVRGTAARPVVFTSERQPPSPGRWGELRVDFGAVDLSNTVIEGSTRGLHTHFSSGTVRDGIFRYNVDGTRLGDSALVVERNRFYGHPGKAYNAHRCRNRVRGNLFRDNRNGVFLFEEDRGSRFEANRFRDNGNPFRLGDFFSGTVRTRGNDWGATLPSSPAGNPDARLETDPATVASAGPSGWPGLRRAWAVDLGGYVDAGPVVGDDGVYAASWAGRVVRVGILDGRILSETVLPDVVDAPPAVGSRGVVVTCWDRGVYLLSRPGLGRLDRFTAEASPADDHRQATPLWVETRVFAATWAGRVHAFDTVDGRLEPAWSFEARGPFRAPLALISGRVLAPSQDGTLYALAPNTGTVAWRFRGQGPFLSGVARDREGTAFFADRTGALYAVDGRTGRLRWSRSVDGPVWYASPAVDGDRVFQGNDAGVLTALDRGTGRVLWRRPLGYAIRSRPLVLGRWVAVSSLGGRLHLVRADTGLEVDALAVGGDGTQSDPGRAGTRVFLGGRDGRLHAVDVVLPATATGERETKPDQTSID